MGTTTERSDEVVRRDGAVLPQIARGAIARRLGRSHEPVAAPAWSSELGATFVTLTQDGKLRGCIGTLQAHRPVVDDVRANAVSAAFGDPRFAPLPAEALDVVRVEVSLLSEAEPMAFASEQDALRQLRPGIDGLILRHGGRRATFLPQVWETLQEPHDFLNHLKRKSGLAPDFWDDSVTLERYTVASWQEGE